MITIREYRQTDRETAIGLFLALNRHEAAITGDRRTDREGAVFCVDDMANDTADGGAVRVAEWDGMVVGLLVFAVKEVEPYVEARLRRQGVVQDLVVAQEHRGRGVGRALLDEAERLARAAGLPRIALTVLSANASARKAYQRAGYGSYAEVMVKELG